VRWRQMKSNIKQSGAAPCSDGNRARPWVNRSTPRGKKKGAHRPEREQQSAEVVEAAKDFLAGARQSIKDERQCYDSNRQVYVENPPPRESINQKAAQKRPGDAAERENPGKQPLIATAFTRGDEIGDCYLSERHQTTGAEALQCAKPN
jgi:hypothetical protein